jgi:hypothetical protein
MRRQLAALLTLAAFTTFVPAIGQSQVGGLIRKAATDAAKKSEEKKKNDGPIQSQFEKECGALTGDVLDQFLQAMDAEIAARAEYDKKRALTKPDAEVNACRRTESTSPEAMKIMQNGLVAGASTDQLTKAMEKNQLDLEAHMIKKCGERESKFSQFDENAAIRNAASKMGITPNCYSKLKEITIFFCRGLTAEQQKSAVENGIRVPGFGGAEWVFTAAEASVLAPRCGRLVPKIDATGYKSTK